MRIPLNRQPGLSCTPVLEVELNTGCRDEIIPILRALQHIYSQPELRQQLSGWWARPSIGTQAETRSSRTAKTMRPSVRQRRAHGLRSERAFPAERP